MPYAWQVKSKARGHESLTVGRIQQLVGTLTSGGICISRERQRPTRRAHTAGQPKQANSNHPPQQCCWRSQWPLLLTQHCRWRRRWR